MNNAIEQYAKEYAEEKAHRAAIEATIKLARYLKWSDQQIINYLKENYKLEDKDINKYLA